MNELFHKLGFYPADILLPKGCDMTKWAVVACDQFTSEPEYWAAVEEMVGKSPSALRLILPEARLKDEDVEELLDTLSFYTGETTVWFVKDGKKMLCSQKVSPNRALMAELASFLPENCIKLV